jgi:hypothetical protein
MLCSRARKGNGAQRSYSSIDEYSHPEATADTLSDHIVG